MVMTLNGARRRSFISKSDGRRAALLFTICLWGIIFGGSYAHSRPRPNCPNSNSHSRPNGGHSRQCPNSSSETVNKPTEPTTLQVQNQTIKPAYPQTTAKHSITTMKSAITDPSLASPVVSPQTAASAPITTQYETKKVSITKASDPTSGKAKDILVNTMTTTTTTPPIVQITNSTSQHEPKSKVTHHSTTMTVTPETSTGLPTSHKDTSPNPSVAPTSPKSTTTRPEASTEITMKSNTVQKSSVSASAVTPTTTLKSAITTASSPKVTKSYSTVTFMTPTHMPTSSAATSTPLTTTPSSIQSAKITTKGSTTVTVTLETSTSHPTSHKGMKPNPPVTPQHKKSTTKRPEASTGITMNSNTVQKSSVSTSNVTPTTTLKSSETTNTHSAITTASTPKVTNGYSTVTSATPTHMPTSSATTTPLTTTPSSIPSAKITTKDSTTVTVTLETSTSHPTSHKGMKPKPPVTPQHKKSTTKRPEASTGITMNSNTVQKSSVSTSNVTPTTTLKSSETTNTHSAITTASTPKVTNGYSTVTSVTPTHMPTSSATTTPLTTTPSSIPSAKITTKDSTTVSVTLETSTSHPTSHKAMKPNPPVTPQHKKSTTKRPKASTGITMNSNTVQKSSVSTSNVTPTTTLKSSETTNTHSAITTASTPKVTNGYSTVTSVTPTHMTTSSATTTPLTTTPSSIPSAKITTKDSTTVTVTPETSTSHPTSHKGMKPNPPVTPQHKKSTTTRPKASTGITMNSNTVQKSSVPTSPVTTTLKSSETTNAHSEMLTSSGTTHANPTTTPLKEPIIIPQTSNGTSHQNDQTKTSTKSPTTMHHSMSTTKTAPAKTTVTPVLLLTTKTTHQTSSASPTTKSIATTISAAIKTSPLTPYTTTAMPKTTHFSNKTPVLTSHLPPETVSKSTPKVTGTEMLTSLGTTHANPTTTPVKEPIIIPQTSNGTSHQNDQTKTSTKSPTTMHPSILTTKTATATTSATPVLHLPTQTTQTTHQTSSASPTTKPIATTISATIKISPLTPYTTTAMPKTTHFSNKTPVLTSHLPPGTVSKSTPKVTGTEMLTSLGTTHANPTTTPVKEPIIIPQTSNGTSHQNDQTKTSTKSPTTMHPSISTTKTATATTSAIPVLHLPTQTTHQTSSASPTTKPIATTISAAIKTSPLTPYTTTAMPKTTHFSNKTPVLTSHLPPGTVSKSTPKVTGTEMLTSLGTTHANPTTTPVKETIIIPQTSNGTSHQNDQTKTSTKSPTTMHPSISTTKTATATTSAIPVLHLPTQTTHQTSSASPTTKPIATTISAAIKTSPLTPYTTTAMPKTTHFSNKTPVLTSHLPPGTVSKSTPKVTGTEMLTSLGTTHANPTTTPVKEPIIIPQTSNGTSHQNDQTKTSTKSPTTMHPSISTTKTATATTVTPPLHLPTKTTHQTSSASPTTKPIATTISAAIKTSPLTTYTTTAMPKKTPFSNKTPVLTSHLPPRTVPKSTHKVTGSEMLSSLGTTHASPTTTPLQEPIIIPQTSNGTSHQNDQTKTTTKSPTTMHPSISTTKTATATTSATPVLHLPTQTTHQTSFASPTTKPMAPTTSAAFKTMHSSMPTIKTATATTSVTPVLSSATQTAHRTSSASPTTRNTSTAVTNPTPSTTNKSPTMHKTTSFSKTSPVLTSTLGTIPKSTPKGTVFTSSGATYTYLTTKTLQEPVIIPQTSNETSHPNMPTCKCEIAVVTSTLQFNSLSPVPSQNLVLNAISDLQNSRESQLNDSVKLLNVTYGKISETSYEVKLTFAVSNISIPVDKEQTNSTLKNLQDVVNVAVNTLLNEPGKASLQPNSSSFQITPNQINGALNYIIQDGDAIQPVSFLQKLQSLKGSSTTSASPLTTSSSPVTSGSAVVTSTLQFNSSPVPSQDLVLKAIGDLRNSRESKLNESVKLLNVTYEKISETSYEIKLTFAVSNVSMPVDIKQRNSTFTHLEDVVNVAVNTLLNEPGKASLQPNSYSFLSTPNKINGSLNYMIGDGDAIQPVSFLQKLQSLKVSSTTSASPLTTSSSPVKFVSGSAVVTSTLQFNSSPVPSQDLVLKAIGDLRNSRESQLNESVKLLNLTYNKISENSYEVKLTFAVSNFSMPVDIKQRNSTLTHLQDVVNVAVNTLLNEPGKASLQPNSSSFLSTPNQINGSLNYIIRDGDAIQPVSFLQKLQSLKGSSTTSASPLATSSSPVKFVSGSAVVTSKLQFNSSPVPSQDLVLKAISDLRNSRESQLNESVKLLNVTYEKISENSYEVKLTFAVSNVSMPVDIKQRNSTLTHLQDVVNVAVNTLLNEPGKASLQPNSSSFLSTPNQINGSLNYIIRDGDAIQPVSFLRKLQSLQGSSTTSASPLATSSSPVISGSAVVTSTLQFNSSSPVPSQDLVLKAIGDLRNSRESQLNESVKLLNVTYEKISENSYKVKLTFAVSNVSMPVDIKQRNSTFTHLQDVVNVAVNTLLNEPGKASLQPNSSSFLSTPNQINGSLNYIIRDGDAILPVSFIQKLQSLKGSSTTSASPLKTSSSPVNFVFGSAVVTSKLQFNSSSPVPSQDLVLKAISDLQNSRESQLSEPVKLVNVSYTKTSETSYAVLLTFVLSNISMPEKPELRNNTFQLVQDTTNNALNTLLNEPGKAIFKPNSSNFSSTQNKIEGSMEYDFQAEDTIKPVSFLNNLHLPPGTTTTNTPVTNTTSLGEVIIYIRLVFITVKSSPNESTVLQLAYSLLDARLRTKRDVPQLSDPVSFVDVTYQRISEKVFALNFGYIINNVTIAQNPVLKNQTLELIQKSINKLLNQILSSPTATPYQFKQANFTGNSTVIRADVEYVFSDNDIKSPSPFIKELILKINGSVTSGPATTTFYPTVVATTGRNNSTSAAWVVAIIVPCAIAIMLIPCWILLCCLLCGCCAGVRRRWDRRRSYNIRYYIHNL
ncbi:uncharacterized protein [Paramisgurnus dabryanus]|uniref:uncharacterized protein isoform X2 n=1 Tax=Paramisgurnus dabryanus TaxID=90735 RepID=UPI003CCF49C3